MHFYLRLIKRIARLSLLRQIIYKTDFWFYGTSVVAYAVTQIIFLYFLFAVAKGGSIAGFTKSELLFAYLTSQWVNAFFFAFTFDNLKLLATQLSKGELDFFYLHPGNLSFHLLFQKISFRNTISMLFINTLASLWIAPDVHLHFSFGEWCALLWVILSSIWLLQILFLMAISCLFFVREFWGPWNFLNTVSDISRYPTSIYPSAVRIFFMTIVPYFIIINPVYSVLHHEYTLLTFAAHGAYVLGYSMLGFFIWGKALQHYESGS